MSTYQPSNAMRRHLEEVDKDPSKAMDLSPQLRRELDGLSQQDLATMAQQVKYSKGAPIHLTDEQNAEFRAMNQHMPTFSKPSAVHAPRAPPGKYSGKQEAVSAMSDAFERFGGSVEAFKAEVFKPVPADHRVGKQEYIVIGTCYSNDNTKVAILPCGCFADPEPAEVHASRVQDRYPWFDFHIATKWSWIPLPLDDETARGVQRTYKDKNLNSIMNEHFETSVSQKQRQLREMREVEERRGPREAPDEEEFPPTQIMAGCIDDSVGDNEVREREE